uniref:Uncharacterized protein n=1 Tax=Salmonella sp. TaxID=599 RepID=A0A482ETE8_SALSP|nr:hypothetical protein NNIBIDOC_00144 [Salmonella sp.]
MVVHFIYISNRLFNSFGTFSRAFGISDFSWARLTAYVIKKILLMFRRQTQLFFSYPSPKRSTMSSMNNILNELWR